MTQLSEDIGQGTFLAQVVTCVRTEHGRVLTIRDHSADPCDEPVRADCLDHVAVAAGDLVLALHVNVLGRPVVIGCLSGTSMLPLPGGYAAEAVSNGLVLKNAQGEAVLAIETVGASPTIKLAEGDVALDVAGRLKIAARSIDMEAKLGNVNITANDDVVVLGERVRLN
jgi:hypothetical protein